MSTRFPPVIREDLPELVDPLADCVEPLAGRTVLVTGAAGFLGGYLADALAFLNELRPPEKRWRLLLLARSLDKVRKRLGHLQGLDSIRFLVQDVAESVPGNERVDYVLHAASAASPRSYLRDPIDCLDTNLQGTRRLLGRAVRDETRGFLYFSTSEVYGNVDPDQVPTPETYVGRVDPTHPRACYIEAKRAAEAYCMAFFRTKEVPVRIVRPFHFHGPGLDLHDGRIVTELIRMGLEGYPIELKSAGTAIRTYGYVLDAAIGSLQVLIKAPPGEAYNLGTSFGETSIHDLARIIAKQFGQTKPVKTNADPSSAEIQGSPDRACPDLSKLKAATGFRPRISLAEGLKRSIAWYRHLRGNRP